MSQLHSTEPVAVVGIGCRFPGGATTPESFWRLLSEGTDVIGPMPPGRFDAERFASRAAGEAGRIATREGGFLEGIDLFDAGFFALSPREARKIDPQHRLLLELTWEALEDAGVVPSSLAGSRTGVYAGLWTGEYENVMYRTPEELDFYSLTGGGRYAASGRISYALDLRGPCLSVDTGCSAALVALHLATAALASGEIDLAVVGAANLILQPHVNIGYTRSGMLSPAARCRFGDAEAAGYVRSDGAGVVILKPLARALADRDPIRGVVLATAVNADGRGSGQLATPSADAQAELLERVYARAGVEPSSVTYVEAHGTGTRAGDPVELEALGRVLGRDRPEGRPLLVGSVKTNIGHTEAAAGMAGLVKALLALEKRTIPASLHLEEPNPSVPWDDLRVEIPRRGIPWPADAASVAGVSSFGITGTNAHVVVAAAPELPAVASRPIARPAVVTLSARLPAALLDQAQNLRDMLSSDPGAATALADLSYTTTCRREHMEHRLALVAESIDEVIQVLDEHLAGDASPALASGDAEVHNAPAVAFVFSGQGSQWIGMGRELMRTAPAFAAAIAACERELDGLVEWSLSEVLAGAEELERVDVVQPVLAGVQIALARQLIAWGVHPAAVVGHSMGEVAAAHIAGALSLGDAMRVIALRSRLLSEIAGAGAMALVDLPEAEVRERLRAAGGRVSVAAINGPRSTVISGDPAAVDALLEALEGEEVFCRRVKVDVASHSAQTEPLLPRLRLGLADLAPTAAAVPFHSTVRVGAPTDAALDAEYWVENLRRPVRLAAAVEGMIAAGVELFVEIAPHPILLSSLADIAAAGGRRVQALGAQRREEPEQRRLLEALARLHVLGAPVAWGALAEEGARAVRLPSYPWQRERHWLEEWEEWSGGESTRGGAAAPRRPSEAETALYRVEWTPAREAPGTQLDQLHDPWLLLGDGELAERIAAGIRGEGGRVLLLPSDAVPAAALAPLDGRVAGVLDLRALDALASAEARSMEVALERSCMEPLALVQALIARGAEPKAGVWWVTRGAQGAGARAPLAEAAPQAALWGLARTLWQEHPELDAHLVDLAPGATSEEAAAQVLAALVRHADEAQLAFADGVAYAARLTPAAEAARTPARWRSDASYLITGGLGELGLLVAEEMVRGGATRLILAGRTALPPRERWGELADDEALARRIEGVLRLERMGASVHLWALDASNEEALARALERFRAERWPEIRGAVHCAGLLENHLLRDLTPDRFMSALRGKAIGAWNLHRLLPELEQTVYFSSVVPVLPQAGQANYAAANALLDSLALARSAAGAGTRSLGWGVWSGAGLVRDAKVARSVEQMRERGLESFELGTAQALFRWCADSPSAHLIVAQVDWARAARHLERRSGASFYADLLAGADQPAEGDAFAAELRAAPPPRRRELLVARLRVLAGQILGVAPAALPLQQPLGRRGLDSLMAMELRNRIEAELDLRLPASVIWNYPTIDLLSGHLAERLEPRVEDAAPAAELLVAPATDVQALIAEVAESSEDEILRMLREA